MTIDELESFQKKYPFKHTSNAVIEDRSALSDWANGMITLPALLAALAKHNGWKEVPEAKQFVEYIALLGYRRHE